MSYFEELHPEMDRYLEDTASAEPEILKRLRKETFQKTTQPHMILGYLQGRLSFFGFKNDFAEKHSRNWNFHRLCSALFG